jgi:hypothetical protein
MYVQNRQDKTFLKEHFSVFVDSFLCRLASFSVLLSVRLTRDQARSSHCRLLLFRFMAAIVESGNALKRRRRVCTLGKILIAVKTDCNPDLGFGARIGRGCRWLRQVVLR